MNDSHANAGHKKLNGTDAITSSCQGFTPVNGDFTLSSITFPSSRAGRGYVGDATFLATLTFLAGVYYPIPFTAITPATGAALGWLD
jgi:hypothetical protein